MPIKNKLILFQLIWLIIILTALSFGYDYITLFDITNKINWTKNLKPQACDYIAVGTSTMLNALNPEVIYETAGKNGLNLAIHGVDLAYTYASLILFFEKHKTKMVIIGLDETMFNRKGDQDKMKSIRGFTHIYYILPFISREKIRAVIKKLHPYKYYAWRFIPFFKYAEFNYQAGIVSVKNALTKKNPVFSQYGFESTDEQWNGDIGYLKNKIYNEISNTWVDIFLETNSLIKENGAEIVWIITPRQPIRFKNRSNGKEVLKLIYELAKTNEVRLFDYSDLAKINMQKNEFYADTLHLNYKGSNAFSRVIANDLWSSQ